ncbi:MAG: prolipoprotein diacylglyceryl transferase [Bacteroidetes bacterium]|nr:MAG: prolipoprotein diacylglyceryl transferase [Bacteroidota bacterium]
MNLSIHWNVSSELIEGWSTPNKYGLLFISGIIIGFYVIRRMFRKEQIPDAILDKLLMYTVIATVVGARLGHVLFYGPYFDVKNADGLVLERGYFSHPVDIFKIYEGGLASHGAAITILIALYIFSKRVSKRPMIWILDRVAAPIAIAGCFIRLGNLVNHEIVGKVTNVPWGFKFMRHDCILGTGCSWDMIPVRHPAQLYEAICYLLAFVVLVILYWKRDAWKRPGLLFGSFLVLVFGVRFMVEFVKIAQTDRDDVWFLNTGQILSIPLVLAGAFIIYRAYKKAPLSDSVESK